MLARDGGLAVLLLLLTFDPSAATPSREQGVGEFLNEFAVKITGGVEVAQGVADDHGFELVEQLPGLRDIYEFRHRSSVSHRSKRSAEDVVDRLRAHPNVEFAHQQRVLGRYKRSPVSASRHRDMVYGKELQSVDVARDMFETNVRTEKVVSVEDMGIEFNDPQFPRMWYLINKGQTGGPEGLDVNVLPVWKKGITGKGVVVSILDDGIDHQHQDLAPNYDPRASADFNDRSDNDPMPEGNLHDNSHGTKCAGEVAAVADNNLDGLGIAFNARIGGVRMLDGAITDQLEGKALTHALGYVDIYSASWGPSDDGMTFEQPGPVAREALVRGTAEGRDGKGSLYVWATGNGGGNDDDCNCDGYVSSIHSMSIGCINDRGLSTYFSEICPSTLAVIHTGGPHVRPGERGFEDPPIKVITVDTGGDNDRFTDQFMGTSAAAPLAAGAFALVLEANPELTWRDMQNIVVETAAMPNPDERGWTINGGGYHINHKFGFGALDVGKMVDAAQNWVTVPEQRSCDVPGNNREMEFGSGEEKRQKLSVRGCGDLDRLEHVQVHVTLDHSERGALSLTLTSPHGTTSQILSPRSKDKSTQGLEDWTFMTVHNWGEDPAGEWTLSVRDISEAGNHGTLRGWALTLYGVRGEDYHNKGVGVEAGAVSGETNRDTGSATAADSGQAQAHVPDSGEREEIIEKEQEGSETVDIKHARGMKGMNAVTMEELEMDDLIDALTEVLSEEGLTSSRKKALVEEATMHDDRRRQTVHLRNLQRRLQQDAEREREEKAEREREEKAEREREGKAEREREEKEEKAEREQEMKQEKEREREREEKAEKEREREKEKKAEKEREREKEKKAEREREKERQELRELLGNMLQELES